MEANGKKSGRRCDSTQDADVIRLDAEDRCTMAVGEIERTIDVALGRLEALPTATINSLPTIIYVNAEAAFEIIGVIDKLPENQLIPYEEVLDLLLDRAIEQIRKIIDEETATKKKAMIWETYAEALDEIDDKGHILNATLLNATINDLPTIYISTEAAFDVIGVTNTREFEAMGPLIPFETAVGLVVDRETEKFYRIVVEEAAAKKKASIKKKQDTQKKQDKLEKIVD